MDIKAYIQSGIIESYVLGLADEQESAELLDYCRQYPEVKAALQSFEQQMEAAAFSNAVNPPAGLKERIMRQFNDEIEPVTASAQRLAPVVSISDAIEPAPKISFWKYIAAASIILLAGSAALNLYLYNNYNDTAARYQALLTERNTLQANNDVFRTKLSGIEESFRIVQNPDVVKVAMPGIKGRENNTAAVYWDTKTKDVYFLPTKLDKAPEGKQYQLWAIVDGKPVDAGLVQDCNGLCKMKNIPAAQAFAITLENTGGSPTPHLDAMYVMGAVKS